MRTFLLMSFMLLAGVVNAAPKSELWDIWLASDETDTRKIDHSAWQHFLQDFVAPDAHGIHRVAYTRAGLTDGAQLLKQYIRATALLDPRTLNRAEQLAYWVNMYNAVTVQVVLAHPSKSSILRMGKGFFSSGPWDDEVISVAGIPLTLNDIEHRILRPVWQDHRIHFVVNCASIGCPNLSLRAFDADNAQGLLNDAEQAYVNHVRGVSVDGGDVTLSSIFQWYREDFANDERSLLVYLSKVHGSLGSRLENHAGAVEYDYDWSLNSDPVRE